MAEYRNIMLAPDTYDALMEMKKRFEDATGGVKTFDRLIREMLEACGKMPKKE